MNQPSELEVINRDGWSRTYPLRKRIISLGSAHNSDIVLESAFGAGVEFSHAQLVAVSHQPNTYTLVNVVDVPIALGSDGRQTLPPSSAISLEDKQSFTLGEFTLIFHQTGKEEPVPVAPVATAGSQAPARLQPSGQGIGLALALESKQLLARQSIQGVITVRNLGRQSEVKFILKLEGLEPDCYDLAPGPVLAAGAEQKVLFSVHHRGHKPLAGDWRIVIRASAPSAYPGETATVSEIIQVLPFHHHHLRLVPSGDVDRLLALPQGELPPVSDQARPAVPSYADQNSPQPWDNTPAWGVTASTNGDGHRPEARPAPAPGNGHSRPVSPGQNGRPRPETPAEEWQYQPEMRPQQNSKPIKLKLDAVKPVKQLHGEEDEWWRA